jgi:predicted glycosyltransferase
MNLIVDISHPAHVHFFRNAIDQWRARGHQVTIVARDKDITLRLLDEYGYAYVCLSRARKGVVGLFRELVEHEGKLLGIIRRARPDVLLEIAGTFIVHAGALTRTPALVFYDTEMATLSNLITYPFASRVVTPSCYQGDVGRKQVRYDGYQELAYMHPGWFTPDPGVLEELDVGPNEKLFVVRFVAWEAGHDVMVKGFSLDAKRCLVQALAQEGRVVITSEGELPPDMQPYQLRISPTKIHHLLAFCSLYVGESATMASESAILGTPFIYVSPIGRGYTDEQEERYGLGYTLRPEQQERAIELALDLAQRSDVRSEWRAKRQRLLADKIDVTAWMVDYVENFVSARTRRQPFVLSGS